MCKNLRLHLPARDDYANNAFTRERKREGGKREKERLCESETSVKWHFSKLIEKVREERVYTRGERVFERDKREEERGRGRARGCSGMLRDAREERAAVTCGRDERRKSRREAEDKDVNHNM